LSGQPVIQSGQVTPGHAVVWTTDGAVQDGGPLLGPSETKLAQLLGANFNTTNDQQIAIPTTITKFQLTRIVVTNASLSLTTAVGGFYPQPAKGGTALVANSQVYSTLTAASVLLNPTLTSYANTTALTSAILTSFSIYFALSTPQGVAATGDIYLFGVILA
jgi:hypothetical protein